MFQQKKRCFSCFFSKKTSFQNKNKKKQYQIGPNRALMGQPKARLHWASYWAAFVGLYGFT